MTTIADFNFAAGFGTATPIADATPADRQAARPPAGEQSGPQEATGSLWARAFGSPYPNGNDCNNPCGFWRYGSAYTGSFDTYDFMLRHPNVWQARGQLFDPIIASPPVFEKANDDVPDEWIEFVKGQAERLWGEFIEDVLTAGDYGFAAFEKVWAVTGGRYVLDCLKLLEVRTTQLAADKSGRFAGVCPDGKGREAMLGVRKSFLYTYCRRGGNLYGIPQLERCRETAWRDWLDAASDLVRLSKKISGRQGVVYAPSGTGRNSDGTSFVWKDKITVAIQALAEGDTFYLPTMSVSGNSPIVPGSANFDQMLALSKMSPIRVELLDYGSNAPAIASTLDRLNANEQRMFAAYHQSPRTGMATPGGSTREAVQHTDTASIKPENISASIAAGFSRGVIDDILALNYGDAARGAVRVRIAKLTDDNVGTDTAALTALHADPDLGPQFREQLDYTAIADRRDLPRRDRKAPIKLERVAVDTSEPTIPDDPEAADDGEETDDDEA